jgi:hypothetical protein
MTHKELIALLAEELQLPFDLEDVHSTDVKQGNIHFILITGEEYRLGAQLKIIQEYSDIDLSNLCADCGNTLTIDEKCFNMDVCDKCSVKREEI